MNNRIDITDTLDTRVVDMMADVEVEVTDEPADFATLIHECVLRQCHGQRELPVGRYTIRLLCVVTEDGSA